jgi:CBS domain containing-hemolysin-like protein
MLSGSELLIAGLFIVALLLMSIVDIALSSVTRIAVRRLLDRPKIKSAPALVALVENRDAVLLSVHILIQLLLIAGSVFLFGAFSRRQVPLVAGMPGTILLMFILVLIFRQLIPRIVATRDPEMVLLYLRPFLQAAHLVMRPFSNVLMRVMNSFKRWEDQAEPDKKEEEKTDEEIQAFIDVGQEEGILEKEEGEMIQSIVEFGDKVAREVMTPRTQIVGIDIDASVDKLADLIISKHHTRIPVYREDLDNIEGIVHERDLLSVWQRAEKMQGLRPLIKPVNFVPETKPIDDLLEEMKDKGDQMVLVVDEYGGVSGLITMKDLVEEIIGDIRDDVESDGEKIVEETNGVYIVPGRTELGVLETKLGMPLVEDTECTTVAGAVVQLFGKLPTPGETIEHQGIQIEVLDADRRRVKRLRMKVVVPHRMTG